MGRMPWYKHEHEKALKGFFPLTLEERGAYITIINLIYSHDDNLYDDDRFIAGNLRVDVRIWKRLKKRLISLEKIHIDDGMIRNEKATTVVRAYLAKAVSAANAGVMSGVSRRASKVGTINKNNRLNGTTVRTPVATKNEEIKSKIENKKEKEIYKEKFDEFYALYPKKVAVDAARERFLTLCKTGPKDGSGPVDPDEIIAGLANQLPAMVRKIEIEGKQMTPAAGPWLNAGKWKDEIEAPADRPFDVQEYFSQTGELENG